MCPQVKLAKKYVKKNYCGVYSLLNTYGVTFDRYSSGRVFVREGSDVGVLW